MTAGDHLEVPRQHGIFHHHGIDLGDGTIAHYLEGRKILRSPIKEFCSGQEFKVVNHPHPLSRGVTLRRAIGRLGEQQYNLLFNNCEHFASWCKTGRHHSAQIDDFWKLQTNQALSIGTLIPNAMITGFVRLLKEGLKDESSQQLAKEGLEKLAVLRLKLMKKLELTLKKAEQWFQEKPDRFQKKQSCIHTRSLLLSGQKLADELSVIEDLEARIHDLLNQTEQST